MGVIAAIAVILSSAADSGRPWILPRPLRYVADYARLLDQATEDRLNGLLQALELQTGVPYVVLTVEDTAGVQLPWYSGRTAMAWGLRREGRDRGVLFVYVARDNTYRLEVGGETAWVLDPNLRAQLAQDLDACIRSGDIAGGILQFNLAALQAIGSGLGATIKDQAGSEPPAGLMSRAGRGQLWAWMGLVVLVSCMIWVLRSWSSRSGGPRGPAWQGAGQWVPDGPFNGFGGGMGAFGTAARGHRPGR